jgi:sugar lactone lactonase YvrE
MMKKYLFILLCAASAVVSNTANAQIIVTVAGGGICDGEPATAAPLEPIYGAVDGAGNIYISETFKNRIRKIDVLGIITTFAGDGTMGFSGDGGPATAAKFNGPAGMCADADGNIYVADGGNNRIRKITPSGTITTVAGTTAGFGGDGGAAVSAKIKDPNNVAIDGAGNLYIGDNGNFRVRKINAAGIISTIAGNGTGGYSGDGGPAVAAELFGVNAIKPHGGNIYIADRTYSVVRKISASGIITTIAGNGAPGYTGDGGPATDAGLDGPAGLEIDGSGNIYISDYWNNRIRRVTPGGIISTYAGTGGIGFSGDGGPASSAEIRFPTDLLFSGSNRYVIDGGNGRVRKIDNADVISTYAGGGAGDGYAANNGVLTGPRLVAFDGASNMYFVYTSGHFFYE